MSLQLPRQSYGLLNGGLGATFSFWFMPYSSQKNTSKVWSFGDDVVTSSSGTLFTIYKPEGLDDIIFEVSSPTRHSACFILQKLMETHGMCDGPRKNAFVGMSTAVRPSFSLWGPRTYHTTCASGARVGRACCGVKLRCLSPCPRRILCLTLIMH